MGEWEQFKKTCDKAYKKDPCIVDKNTIKVVADKIKLNEIQFNNTESIFIKNDFAFTSRGLGNAKQLDNDIRKGDFNYDAYIDLHGMTLNDAYNSLIAFVERSIVGYKRKLLVITGKGEHSKNNDTIKNNIKEWLKTPYFSDKILKYTSAHRKHGGEGAIYIILKKHLKSF